jgi:hypothetical protein
MARTLLRRGETPKDPDATRSLTARVREQLGLGEDVTVSIAEFACGEAACGGAETIILIMRPGCAPQKFELKMPVALLGDDELRAALASAAP